MNQINKTILCGLLLCLLGAAGKGYGQENLDEGLVAYYPFNGNAQDESGNENHGEAYNVELTKDRFRNKDSAYLFVPEQKSYIDLGFIDLNLNEDFTFSVWAYPTPGKADPRIISYGRDSGFEILINNWNTWTGKPENEMGQFAFNFGHWSNRTVIADDTPKYDKWYFVTVVKEGENLKYYLNGDFIISKEYTNEANTGGLPLNVGRKSNWEDDWWSGVIDDLRIYNRPLSGEEISLLFDQKGYGAIRVISNSNEKHQIEAGGLIVLDYEVGEVLPISYKWEFNGEPIAGATEAALTIENAQLEHTGRYRLVTTNTHGTVKSHESLIKIIPIGAPRIFADGTEVIENEVKGGKAEITFSSTLEDSLIFYTLDGSEPSFETLPYLAPFTLDKTTVINAVAYSVDFSQIAVGDPAMLKIVPAYDLNVSIRGQGSVEKDPTDGPYMKDLQVKLKAFPNEGWRFHGWNGDLTGSVDEGSVVMDGAKSVRATFQPIPKYTLDTTSGGGVVLGNEKTPYLEDTNVTLTAEPQEGWTFMKWSGDALGDQPQVTITMDSDKQVTALFGTPLESIATGKGKLLIEPDLGLYGFGTKIKITPVPDAGYYLGIWGGDAKGAKPGLIDFEITKPNPKITALFAPLKEDHFTITALSSLGGRVLRTPQSNTYTKGQQVALIAMADTGYTFAGWTGDVESVVNRLDIIVDDNKVLTATFIPRTKFPITLNISSDAQISPFGFGFNSDDARTYSVEGSLDLTKWIKLGKFNGTGESVKFVETRKARYPQQFYRVRLVE